MDWSSPTKMSTNGLGFKIFLIPVFPLMLASFSASASNAFSNWLDRRVAASESATATAKSAEQLRECPLLRNDNLFKALSL